LLVSSKRDDLCGNEMWQSAGVEGPVNNDQPIWIPPHAAADGPAHRPAHRLGPEDGSTQPSTQDRAFIMSIEDVTAQIISETEQLSADFRARFEGDADAELLAWLQLAVQREAMVSHLYGRACRDRRLEGLEGSAVAVVRDALTLIWQQEASHTGMLAARVVDGVFAGRPAQRDAAFARVKGTVDGAMLDWLTDGEEGLRRVFARVAARLGKIFNPQAVPDFALEMPAANAGQFFVLARALEQTARDSYRRMVELLPAVVKASTSIQPQGLLKPVRDTELDETFHERAFAAMTTWVTPEGQFDPKLDAKTCMGKLREILVATTGVEAFGPQGRPIVLTDGGLESLFAKHEMPVIVLRDVPGA
jgi:hypothetical protein